MRRTEERPCRIAPFRPSTTERGGDLIDEPRFVQPYTEALALLHDPKAGALETVRRFR